MSKSLKGSKVSVASVAALWSLLTAGFVLPIYASSSANGGPVADYDGIGHAEQVFFGKVDTTDTYLKRLELLELGIFGRVRSGSQDKRFQRIVGALGVQPGKAHVPSDGAGKDPAVSVATATASGAGADSLNQSENLIDIGTPPPSTSATPGTSTTAAALTAASSFSAVNTAAPTTAITDKASPSVPAKVATTPAPSAPSINNTTNKSAAAAKPKTGTTQAKPIATAKPNATANANSNAKPDAKKPVVVLGKETPKIAQTGDVAKPQSAQAASAGAHSPSFAEHRLERPGELAKNNLASRDKEIDVLFKQGMVDFRDHRNREAQTCFKQILAIDPRNIDAYFNLGSMAEAGKDYLEALTFYRAALASNPTDKDLKKAVHSMEDELYKQRAKTASKDSGRSAGGGTNQPGSPLRYTADAPMNQVPVVSANQQTPPVTDVAATDAPVVPVQQIDPNTFSLQTAQNGLTVPYAPLNGLNAPYNGVPVYGVPPTLGANIPNNNFPISNVPPANSNRGTFNGILQVGTGLALRSSGLHCPICRVLGGLH